MGSKVSDEWTVPPCATHHRVVDRDRQALVGSDLGTVELKLQSAVEIDP